MTNLAEQHVGHRLLLASISTSTELVLLGLFLLGCHEDPEKHHRETLDLAAHRDEQQVQLDVDRSFVYYPKGIRCRI
jgi:hypothetical protein